MAMRSHPGRVHVHLGYDEARAHRLVAGADAIAVPSRFEPCGLTQLYGLRYGTLPIVRRVGGLADTVTDASPKSLAEGTATGFAFDAATPAAFEKAVKRAAEMRTDADAWHGMMRQAMAQPLSWAGPAKAYLDLYQTAWVAREER
jgi:starch synthase